MTVDEIFSRLWEVYVGTNPKVEEMRNLIAQDNPNLQNDHIALRTLKHPAFGIERLINEFVDVGYEVRGHYHFEQKKLDAVHLEHATVPAHPKVFISELLVEQCSTFLQDTLEKALFSKVTAGMYASPLLSASGGHWGVPNYAFYKDMLQESEYAAWFYVYGFVPNHFTVKVNSLSKFAHLSELNEYLVDKGYRLNLVGGKIKGSPELFLEQSSTLADPKKVAFEEGEFEIPSVFYEFAQRYKMPNGAEFSAFIEGNADKIFESTNSIVP